MSTKKYITGCCIFIVLFLAYTYIATDVHEMTHKQIFLYHGCIDITVQNHLFTGKTTCNEWSSNATVHDKKESLRLNTEFDMKDYSIQFLTQLIITMAAIILLVIIATRK